MELWIRTQDRRKLVCAKDIRLDNIYYDDNSIDMYANDYHIGRYFEERALEILDEIQFYLQPKVVLKNISANCETLQKHFNHGNCFISDGNADVYSINGTMVYDMPKE